MFRPGFGEIMIIVIILGIFFIRHRAEQSQLQSKMVHYMRQFAPESRGGYGGWRLALVGFLGGIGLCAALAYLVWRYYAYYGV